MAYGISTRFPGVHYPTRSLSSYNQTRKKRRSSFMNSSLVGALCVLTYPGQPPHRSWDSAIQPQSHLAFLPLLLPSVQPSTFSPIISSPPAKFSQSSSQALGIPSSCSFTGSIPEGPLLLDLQQDLELFASTCPGGRGRLVDLRPNATCIKPRISSQH